MAQTRQQFAGGGLKITMTGMYTMSGLTARAYVFDTNGASRTAQLPDATNRRDTQKGGPGFYVVNEGPENLTVQDDGAFTVTTLTAGQAAIICLVDDDDNRGEWADWTMSASVVSSPQYNNLYHLIGGNSPDDEHYRYNYLTDVWTQLNDLSQDSAFSGIGLTASDDVCIYIGNSSGSASDACTEYTEPTDSYVNKTDLSFGSCSRSNTESDRVNLYVFGFSADDTGSYEYDFAGDSFTARTSMPVGSVAGKLFTDSTDMYLVQGAPNGQVSGGEVQIFDTTLKTWSSGAVQPWPWTDRMNGFILDEKFFKVSGDREGNDPSAEVTAYEPIGETWTAETQLPTLLLNHAGRENNGRGYVTGGNSSTESGGLGATADIHYSYTSSTETWVVHTVLPDAKTGPVSVGL